MCRGRWLPACALLSVAEHRHSTLRLPAKGAGSQATPKIWGVALPKFGSFVWLKFWGFSKSVRAASIAALEVATQVRQHQVRCCPNLGSFNKYNIYFVCFFVPAPWCLGASTVSWEKPFVALWAQPLYAQAPCRCLKMSKNLLG